VCFMSVHSEIIMRLQGHCTLEDILDFFQSPPFRQQMDFFYLCKKCEADSSCFVSCPFDDSQFYKA